MMKALESADFMERAVLLDKGNKYEDFEEGQVFKHHWGRTLNSGDNSLFTTLTLHFNPLYFNAEYAKSLGHDKIPVCPLLVFNTVLGLSVEDLSEAGGPFLGINDCVYGETFYEGDTLSAESTVVSKRITSKDPNRGVVTWKTVGFNQRGEQVVEFLRSNLVACSGFKPSL
jgi:itaconyl-CoA hydratase